MDLHGRVMRGFTQSRNAWIYTVVERVDLQSENAWIYTLAERVDLHSRGTHGFRQSRNA